MHTIRECEVRKKNTIRECRSNLSQQVGFILGPKYLDITRYLIFWFRFGLVLFRSWSVRIYNSNTYKIHVIFRYVTCTRSTWKPKKNTETHTQKPKKISKILKYRKIQNFTWNLTRGTEKYPKKFPNALYIFLLHFYSKPETKIKNLNAKLKKYSQYQKYI